MLQAIVIVFAFSGGMLWLRRRQNGINPVMLFVCCFSGALALIMGFLSTHSANASNKPVELAAQAPTDAQLPDPVLAGPLKDLQANCLACHGGVMDGKKIIKGGFDIGPLLNDGIVPRHSTDWATVVEMIREEEMPPEDSKYSLNDAVRKEIATTVFAQLDRKEIPERVLTATEMRNTVSQIFEFDTASYDPFEKLAFVTVPDARYETVDAARLMSAAYLRELDAGLTATLTNVVGRSLETYGMHRGKPVTSWDLFFNDNKLLRTAPVYLANVEGPMVAEAALKKEVSKVKELADDEERRRLKNELKQKARALYSKKDGRPVVVDLRIRDPEPLWASSTRNIAPGHYRLTFTAKAINRDLVRQTFHEVATSKSKGLKRKFENEGQVWAELLHNKMQLQVQRFGIARGNRGTLIAGAKNGAPLATFTVEDNVEQEFSCEIRSTVPFRLGMSWLNGPVNSRLERLKLNRVGKQGRKGSDYKLPATRITSVIRLEKLNQTTPKIPNELAAGANESQARKQLTDLITELSLERDAKQLLATFDALDKSRPLTDRYLDGLKWILMSKQNVTLRYDKDDAETSARFASYSLLKKHPDKKFRQHYRQFHEGETDAETFAKSLVADPGFQDLLKTFSAGWLERWADLDEKKFNIIERGIPFEEETIAYLNHLFVANRPASELYFSDYRFVNGPMAAFYKMLDRPYAGQEFAQVKTPGRGGLLQQANFYISRSDGVDPRPFNRAKWIAENALGKILSEPPGDIDSSLFISSVETKTFKKRTQLHAQNKLCASCHRELDEIAFSMHNYDTLGRPIGEQDEAADRELAVRLTKAQETMAHSLTKHLISCIIGRDPNIYDMRITDEIVKATKATDHRAADILALIVKNYFGPSEA
jgi:hypothetical protein